MAKYKLNITYEFETDDLEDVINKAEYFLVTQDHDAQIALLRDGDRSGANLLVPINDKHYKHGKILLSTYRSNNESNPKSSFFKEREEPNAQDQNK